MLIARRKQDPNRIDLGEVAKQTSNFSGAELEQVVMAAILENLDIGVPLATDGLLASAKSTIPLAHSRKDEIEALRRSGSKHYVSVS